MVVDQIEHHVGIGGEQRALVVSGFGKMSSVDDVLLRPPVEEPLRGSFVELVGREPSRLRSCTPSSPSPWDPPVLQYFGSFNTASSI